MQKCLELIWKAKIKELSAGRKRHLADYLGIDYFTMMGKVNQGSHFTQKQYELLKKYDWSGPWTDGQSQELDGTELDEMFEDEDEK